MNFFSQLKKTLADKENTVYTENGAAGYRTTGDTVLDLNFMTSSLRRKTAPEIQDAFRAAWQQNPERSIQWLFFLRDIRGGMGERRTFRIILDLIAEELPCLAQELVRLKIDDEYVIPHYGRWDDILFAGTPTVVEVIKDQLAHDLENLRASKPVSLMAKWLPSPGTTNKARVAAAKELAERLGMKVGEYRRTLSRLRKHIDLVETKMSAGEWDKIQYEHVPSRANLKYASAFLRHDRQRRHEFLAQVAAGEKNIHTAALFPHDIVHMMGMENADETTLEQLWKELPRKSMVKTIVVADGSSSMETTVDRNSSVTALEVANALAIYCSESLDDEFAGKYITFSKRPQLVDLNAGDGTLKDKIRIAEEHCEVASTNIEAVFDLILETACENNLSQEELPGAILVISDMEFDMCAEDADGSRIRDQRLFDVISAKFTAHGFRMPKLIFWNVDSRTGALPLTENPLGVSLISGFSQNSLDIVLSGEVDPAKALYIVLDRYSCITDKLTLCAGA